MLLMLVPGFNVLAGIGWLVFGAWFLAVRYGDSPIDNHALKPAEQRALLSRRRPRSLTFAAGVTVSLLIPVMQFAVMPAAVAGATGNWADDLNRAKAPSSRCSTSASPEEPP